MRRMAAVIVAVALAGFMTAGRAAAEPDGRLTLHWVLSTENQFHLVPVAHEVTPADDRPEKALELLIAGPPPGGPLRGLIPPETRVLGYRLVDGTAYADFSGDIRNASVGSSGEALLIDSIVLTLAQFPGVERVQILVDGAQPGSIGGHIEIDGPIATQGAWGRSRFSGFADASGHWAEGEITALYASGVLAGFPDGRFAPGGEVTRSEFVKMIVKASGLAVTADSAPGFEDVPPGAWYGSYLGAAVSSGIVVPSDYGGVFGANTPVTRREVAVMLVRAAGLEREAVERRCAALPFSDTASQPDWARGYLSVAFDRSFIRGYPDGTFRPYGRLTRAEAAAVVTRFLGYGGPNVFMLAPSAGLKVQDRVLVFGVARVFEAALDTRLKSGGEVVARVCTMATEGAPGWGAYAAVLRVPPGGSGAVTVEALTYSARDGSEQDLTWREVIAGPPAASETGGR